MVRSPHAAALTAAASLLLAAAPDALPAQSSSPQLVAPGWRVELGAALPGATFTEDGDGGGVTAGLAPALGVAAVWSAGRSTTAELVLRGSHAPVTVETSGSERDAGSATQLDVVAAIGYEIGSRVVLRGGAGLSMLRGDDAVVPFRDSNGSPFHLAGEAGALVRLTTARPIGLAITAHFMQLGGATIDDPVEEGTLTRVLVGVTYGR